MSAYIFSQRARIAELVGGVLEARGADLTPANIVTALEELGFLREGIFADGLPKLPPRERERCSRCYGFRTVFSIDLESGEAEEVPCAECARREINSQSSV